MRKGWSLKSLDELFDIKSSKRVHKKDWKTNGIPFYRAREVVKLAQNGTVDNELFISEELYNEFTKEKKAPKEGDIIISAVGTLGQCYLVKKNDKFYFKDASVLWFEKISDVNERYIEFAFKSESIKKQVHDKSMGATVGTLTISRAKIIKIPIPSLEEQQTIVAKLDQAFAAIDQAKANIEKNIANAKELFQSKLNQIFSQKGEHYTNWQWIQLGKICKTGAGGTPLKSKKEYYENGDIPWLLSGEVNNRNITSCRNFITQKGLDNSSAKLFPKDSVLIAMYGATAGQVGILRFESTSNQAVCAIFPNEKFISDFLYYTFLFKKNELIGKAVGNAQPNISQIKIKETEVPLLELEEQQQIVTQLDKLQEQTNLLVIKYQQKLANLEELKKSILEKAFKGELI